MLACLRMLLAFQGIEVAEAALVEQVSLGGAEGTSRITLGINPDVPNALPQRYHQPISKT
jgi:hypothetical protein